MLHQGKLIILFFIVICFVACNKNEKLTDLTNQYRHISIYIIGDEVKYQVISQLITDTLSCWEKNNIAGFRSVNCNSSSYKVDSLLCFNSQKNKLITCILEQNCNQDFGDGIHFLYGVKIKEEWYFFRGPYIFLPRKFYQKETHTPLSYVKLHETAMKEVYRGYLKKGKKGQWEINERFFSDITSVAWCTNCVTQEDWDNAYLSVIRENWAGKDNKSVINE